jgi:hypothetical protein
MSDAQTLTSTLGADARTQSGITEIAVGGFKSIASKQSIEVRPLTILAGANSSGKSSFVQPLLLLKQTLDAPYDPGPLLLDGPNVKFTSGGQFVSHVKGSPAFHIAVRTNPDSTVAGDFTWKEGQGVQILDMEYTSSLFKSTLRLRPQMTPREIDVAVPAGFKPLAAIPGLPNTEDQEWAVKRERCFLVLQSLSKRNGNSPVFTAHPAGISVQYLQQVIHVPGLRGSRDRMYPSAGLGPAFPGAFDHYAASLVDLWQTEEVGRPLVRLNDQLNAIGLTRSIRAKRVNDAQIELHVDRLPVASRSDGDFVNIADVGFGVPTALPVLVALIAAQPG